MIKNYFKFLFLGFFLFSVKANAQCTSCTTTITGTDASNHTVGTGTTLCISPTGTATGTITLTGGILCNQGAINSTSLFLSSGTFNNYGTTNTNQFLIGSGGTVNNYGITTTDTLLSGDSINNSGTITSMYMWNNFGSTLTNMGSVTTNNMYDTIARVYNLSNAKLIINNDFSNVSNSIFFNYGLMSVGHDFLNSSSSYFEADCMMNIGHDWYNNAVIVGGITITSCGGFNITGFSSNTGSLGSSSSHMDICDAGHPAGGIDFPGGSIASSTTYCSCSNACVSTLGIHENDSKNSELIQNLYPNPATNDITIEINCPEGIPSGQIEVMDMMGRIQVLNSFISSVGGNKTTIDVSKLAQGIYILRISDGRNSESKKIFTVVK